MGWLRGHPFLQQRGGHATTTPLNFYLFFSTRDLVICWQSIFNDIAFYDVVYDWLVKLIYRAMYTHVIKLAIRHDKKS
jgi:hypothetical protein